MPSLISFLVVAAALATAPLAATASALPKNFDLVVRQQQDPNTPLYLNAPFCDYYQCAIIWGAGTQATVNWLNAPEGDVQVDLMTDASSRVAYPIARAPAISNSCDAGQGYGVAVPGTTCGGFVFTVPSAWDNGNYTMRASHVQQPQLESYTDVILIMNNGTVANTPFAVVSGSVEGGASSTAAPASSTGGAPSSTTAARPSSTARDSSTSAGASSAAPSSVSRTSSAARPSSTATSDNSNSSSRLSTPASLCSVAALALGLAMLL